MNVRHQPAYRILYEQKCHDEPVQHLRGDPVLQTSGHEIPYRGWQGFFEKAANRGGRDALDIAPFRQGCGSRVEERAIGLTGPATRSLARTGSRHRERVATIVLTTQRSEAGVSP